MRLSFSCGSSVSAGARLVRRKFAFIIEFRRAEVVAFALNTGQFFRLQVQVDGGGAFLHPLRHSPRGLLLCAKNDRLS
jgi:hypothetical protein